MKAKVPGYRVGGKTGTAQKINNKTGRYEKGAYVSSFVGIIPLDKPKFVILVALDQPEKAYYASEVAAPVFSNIASFAVRHYGIDPEYTRVPTTAKLSPAKRKNKSYKRVQQKALAQIEENRKPRAWEKVPKLKGLSLREVMRKYREQGLDVDVYGAGRLTKSYPEPGKDLPANKKVKLYFK